METYGGVNGDVSVYFRGLNQSDLQVQAQMTDFLDRIVAIDHIELKPFCWLKDFQSLMESPKNFTATLMTDPTVAQVLELNPDVVAFLESDAFLSTIDNMSFDQVLNLVMSQPMLNRLYSANIRRNASGEIEVSRCSVLIRNLDYNSVNDQITLLRAQNDVTASHPLNEDTEEYNCFLYKDLFHLWEVSQQDGVSFVNPIFMPKI